MDGAMTDPIVIARRYLWSGLVFLVIGGVLALLMRWQWARPGEPVPLVGDAFFPGGAVTPAAYAALFTGHGVIMIFFAVTPLLLGCFGSLTLPILLGVPRMALPRLHGASLVLTWIAQALALASLLDVDHGATSGWTMYPPLSTGPTTPGVGQDLLAAAVMVMALATLSGAIAYVTTIVARRSVRDDAGAHGWWEMPLTVWGFGLAAALTVLFAPVLFSGTAMLLVDRHGGSDWFGAAGDPLLYQHVFWLFGHPEVYILVLPVWGVVGDLLGVFTGRAPAWRRASIVAMGAVAVMSSLVYGHHMYTAGIGPGLRAAFEATTLAISVPSAVLGAGWLLTLSRGSLRRTVPMLFALGVILVFGIGGLTGLLLATVATDVWLHDTLWVVGHFHLVMAAATLLGAFAALYYWAPWLLGRALDPRLGAIHAAGTVVFALLTFGGMIVAGWAGQPRRLVDRRGYAFLEHLAPLHAWTSVAALALAASQLALLAALLRRRPAAPSADPWSAPPRLWSGPPALVAADPSLARRVALALALGALAMALATVGFTWGALRT